jgi:hypothetical protein
MIFAIEILLISQLQYIEHQCAGGHHSKAVDGLVGQQLQPLPGSFPG